MQSITFIFDDCDVTKVDHGYIKDFEVVKPKKDLFRKNVLSCSKCKIKIDHRGNAVHTPFDVQELTTTVFDALITNNIKTIIVEGSPEDTIIYLPFRLEEGRNVLQDAQVDENDDLHLVLQR